MTKQATTARTKAADKSTTTKAVITLTTKQQEWRTDLFAAIADHVNTGVKALNVVLDARRLKVPVEAVKALVTEAYLATGQVTEATAKKRGSDAAVFIKASSLPKELPGNIQRAADIVRKQEREAKGQQRKPRQPTGTEGTTNGEAKVGPVGISKLIKEIEALRASLDDQAALDILASMADLAGDLADQLAIEIDNAA